MIIPSASDMTANHRPVTRPRRTDPGIFYIAWVHGCNQYGLAAWTGISGDKSYKFDRGGPVHQDDPRMDQGSSQIGPLGAVYPDYMCIPEGDTPTLLYLIQNELGDPEHPEWGSWGGRYAPSSEGGKHQHYSDVAGSVVGTDGQEHVHVSNQATVWRWRDTFQDDFAARIRWTVSERYENANHAPLVSVNGSGISSEAVHITAEAGTRIELDASESYDPDSGDNLTFTWSQYKEPTATQMQVAFEVAPLVITNPDPDVPIVRLLSTSLPPTDAV